MKPATSPFVSAATAAAITLTAFVAPSIAQQSTTVTEKTVVDNKVIIESRQPNGIVTTEIEFQPASTANDLNLQMLRDFGPVEQNDPKVAIEIAHNPEIVQNTTYVAKHPALQAFLDKYPSARNEIVESPGNFVIPAAGSKWNSHEAAGIPRD